MPSREDYKAMHEDAIQLMDASEKIIPVAKRMARFSQTLLNESPEKPSKEDKELRKGLTAIKLKRIS